jgi:Cupin-like domain
MTDSPRPMAEWRDIDAVTLQNQIIPLNRPAVLRNLVADWPVVRAAKISPSALIEYIGRFDSGRPVVSLLGDASIRGEFSYSPDMKGLNFERRKEPLRVALDRLLACLDQEHPPAISIQASSVPDHLPGFELENANRFVHASIIPRIWINNTTVVQAHFDAKDNVGCVVAGHRRFTVFPPDQVSNLYIGPLEFTPAGPCVSLVSPDDPDLKRFPLFERALANAEVADLGPGDAIFIPYLWWHHVKSADRINILVNYWWNTALHGLGSPMDCLYHGILALGALPPAQREAWRAMFDHFVFHTHGAPATHLATQQRGVLGPMTPELAQKLRSMVMQALERYSTDQ